MVKQLNDGLHWAMVLIVAIVATFAFVAPNFVPKKNIVGEAKGSPSDVGAVDQAAVNPAAPLSAQPVAALDFPWANYPERRELESSKTYDIIIANRVVMGAKARARIVITKVLEMGDGAQVSDSAYVFEGVHIGAGARLGTLYAPVIAIMGGIRDSEEKEEHDEMRDFKNINRRVILFGDDFVTAALQAARIV